MKRKILDIVVSFLSVILLSWFALKYPALKDGIELLFVLPIMFFTLSSGWGVGVFVAALSSLFSFWSIGVGPGASMRIVVFFAIVLLLGMRQIRRRLYEEIKVMEDVRSILYMMDFLEKEIRRVEQEGGKLCVAVIGLDNFEKISRYLSPAQIDLLLRAFSKMFLRFLRPTDMMVRYVDDKFIIVFPNTDIQKAVEVLGKVEERLRLHSNHFSLIKNLDVDLFGFSAGVVEYNKDTSVDIRGYFVLAEDALDRAQQRGGGYEIVQGEELANMRTRRYWPRVNVHDGVDVVLYDESGKAHKVVPVNICLGGVMFFSPVEVKDSGVYDLELVFEDGERLIVDAKAVWHRKVEDGKYQVGVFLSQLSPYQKLMLSRKLKELSKRG